VKLRKGTVGATTAGGGNLRSIAPGLNLYRLKVTAGSAIEKKAAELEKLRGEAPRGGGCGAGTGAAWF
jgi:hypothetical protein